MKSTIGSLSAILILALWLGDSASATETKYNGGQSPQLEDLIKAGPLPPEIRDFAKAKRRQAQELAEASHEDVPAEALKFFDAAAANDFKTACDVFRKLGQKTGWFQKGRPTMWQPIIETEMAAAQFSAGEPKYAFAFGRGIIESIPKGSIYFGGTDPGRGLVTALCKSHENGDPIFVLTQNALADNTYLAYLRQMYGSRIYVPSTSDSQRAFNDYLTDATRRLEHDEKSPDEPRQIKPGEEVHKVNGRIQVSGQVAVMTINGLLVKTIFDKNPDHEFYIEESFPLDWMYPYLSPNGLILKINRTKLDSIPAQTVAKDETFWTTRADQMVGPWLTPQTPVKDLCAFARKVHLDKNLSTFGGDPKFVKDDYAIKSFSKLRSSIGGVYQWRAQHTTNPDEKKRMEAAAEFAFKQSYAFCPFSPEALFRYVQLLLTEGRTGDAILLTQTTSELDPKNNQIAALLQQLQQQRH